MHYTQPRGLSPGMRCFIQTGVVPAEADHVDDFAAVFGDDDEEEGADEGAGGGGGSAE